MEIIDNYGKATISLIENLKGTPLGSGFKKACLASLDYLTRLKTGQSLNDEKKESVGNILIIGTTINNYYDIGLFPPKAYKQLRRQF